MNFKSAACATLTALITMALSSSGMALSSSGQAPEAMAWTDISGGTLAGSSVSITGVTASASIFQSNLSTGNYSCAPLTAAHDTLSHGANNNWTATFSPPIVGEVLWYGSSIRGGGAFPAGGGPVTYTFDHTPTILCGFAQGIINGNTLELPEDGLHYGILKFTGSFSTLSSTTNSTGPSFQSFTLAHVPTQAGIGFCFGDGTGTGCPCANNGGTSEGCSNSTLSGGRLEAGGSNSAGADDLTMTCTNLLPGQPALLFFGDNAVSGGAGILFGDGLRCAGGNVVRLGVQVPDGSGTANWGPGLGTIGGWSGGDVKRFQGWYRDPGGPCGTNFNLTNGSEVTFFN